MSRLTATILGLVVALAASPAAAQRGPVYCNVTAIKSDQLSNGVRVTIEADGQLQWDIAFDRLVEEGALRQFEEEWGRGYMPTERFRRLPIIIRNARSKLGSAFVPIDKYPVSHAEISIPEWAHEGVGLEINIVNYLGWVTGEGNLLNFRYNLWIDSSDDQNSIIVAWEADRFPPPPKPKTPDDSPEEIAVTSQDGKLDIRAVNARLQAVANAVSANTGIPVVAPADQNLRVSLALHDLSPEQALQTIAMGSGLCAYPSSDGGWVIADPRAGGPGYAASVARTIPLTHLRALDALDLLPGFLLDYVHADQDTNAIVAIGPPWMLDRIREDLAELDVPPPEVSLDLVALEYTSAQDLTHALQLERFVGDFAAGLDSLTGGLRFLWLESLPRGWELLLNSLQTKGSTQLRARATLRVLNGHQASISAGQERTMVLESLQGPWLVANLERIGTLHMLNVQPLVGRGDEVMLSLGIVIRSLAGTDPNTGLPILSLRRANGTTRVRDGETLVLAGLSMEQEAREDRALPILGRLPVIGGLFRAPARPRSHTQLAFFVTPHILRDSPPREGESNHG